MINNNNQSCANTVDKIVGLNIVDIMKQEVALLIDYLKALKFSEARTFVLELKNKIRSPDLKEIIFLVSDDEDGVGLLAYTFLIDFLIKKDDPVLWNEIARDILSNNLCHYKFAYAAALYHAKKVCELDEKNVTAWEYYLDIGRNRTKMLDDQETMFIAKKILELDPSSVKGKIYMS
jgi:hypothetical protein